MNQTCTPDLLVRWLYEETTLEEAVEARGIIEDDLLMREEFQSLVKAYHMLPKVTFSAPPKALDSILQYSKQAAAAQ